MHGLADSNIQRHNSVFSTTEGFIYNVYTFQIYQYFHQDLTAQGVLHEDAFLIGPVQSPKNLMKIHLFYTEASLKRTEEQLKIVKRQRQGLQDLQYTVPVIESLFLESDSISYVASGSRGFRKNGIMFENQCLKKNSRKLSANNLNILKSIERADAEIDDENIETMDVSVYRTIKPQTGYEYQIYYVDSSDHGRKRSHQNMLHQVTLTQSYESLRIEKKKIQEADDTLHIITLVENYEDMELLNTFINSYERVCLQSKELYKCSLLIAYSKYSHQHRYTLRKSINDYIVNLIQKYDTDARIRKIEVDVKSSKNTFYKIVHSLYSEHQRLMFVPLEFKLTNGLIYRCQLNTERKKSVYFPVLFNKNSSDGLPTWTPSQFYIMCIYNHDFKYVLDLIYRANSLTDQDHEISQISLNEFYKTCTKNYKVSIYPEPDSAIEF